MFIDDWFSDFYTKLPLGYQNEAKYCFGQVFWTHAYYPHENLELWRPIIDPSEKTMTCASQFCITAAGADSFRRSIPLHSPKLETNEEFIVIKAKHRPVVLAQTELPLSGINNRGFRGRIQRRRTLVAQVFGLADSRTGESQFSLDFVNRVRRMEFPQLMFLPRLAGIFEVDSLLRLDEVQSVFTPHLDARQFCLSDAVATLLRQQITFLMTGEAHPDYADLRELLLNS